MPSSFRSSTSRMPNRSPRLLSLEPTDLVRAISTSVPAGNALGVAIKGVEGAGAAFTDEGVEAMAAPGAGASWPVASAGEAMARAAARTVL